MNYRSRIYILNSDEMAEVSNQAICLSWTYWTQRIWTLLDSIVEWCYLGKQKCCKKILIACERGAVFRMVFSTPFLWILQKQNLNVLALYSVFLKLMMERGKYNVNSYLVRIRLLAFNDYVMRHWFLYPFIDAYPSPKHWKIAEFNANKRSTELMGLCVMLGSFLSSMRAIRNRASNASYDLHLYCEWAEEWIFSLANRV